MTRGSSSLSVAGAIWITVAHFIAQGGGGALRYRGGGGAPALRISRKKGSFLRPPHVRDFVKEWYFFVPRYEVWGGGGGVKNPLTIHEI